MSQNFRLNTGGLINRDKPIEFKFNGKKYIGYEGDTLASALLANGIHLIGRSFKYHRPRGFFGAGVDEPNAKMQVEINGCSEPNINATEIELVNGLSASSQNCWPNVNFDIGGINNLLSTILPAGFYYKTFMWPKSFWKKIYEPLIRWSAGLGKSPTKPDPELISPDKSPKSSASPRVDISTYSIVFTKLGAYPPPHIPLVELESAELCMLAAVKSPKSVPSPFDAIVK